MRSEYQSSSDRNRANSLAQMRQQMFWSGTRPSTPRLSTTNANGTTAPAWQAGDISQLGQLGGIQQAQAQAELGATQEANRMTAMEPYERLGQYGYRRNRINPRNARTIWNFSHAESNTVADSVGYRRSIRWYLWEHRNRQGYQSKVIKIQLYQPTSMGMVAGQSWTGYARWIWVWKKS